MTNPDNIDFTPPNTVNNLTLSPVIGFANTLPEVTSIELLPSFGVDTVVVEDAQNNLTVEISIAEGYIPVTSVNGQTGDVVIDTVTSVNGQSGIVVLTFPVTSVNGQTGDVVLTFPVTSVNGQTGAITTPTKYTTVNPTLTVTNGVASWTVSHGLGQNVIVELRNASTNAIIEAEVILNAGSTTVNFNSNSANIASGTYRIVVIG